MKPVNRSIYFFNVQLNQWSNGNFIPINNIVPVSKQIFSHIKSLPYSVTPDTPSKYLTTYDENVLYMHIDTNVINTSKTIEGQFGISRRNALPVIENQGTFTGLTLPPTAGVAEITHFVYFIEDKIMGVEFNFYGPRSSRLGFYIQEKTSLISQFLLIPILRMDVSETLNKIGEVSDFRFQAHRSAQETIKELNEDLAAAFNASATASEAEIIEIVLRKKEYSRKGFPLPLKIKKLIEVLKNKDKRDQFKKMGSNAYDPEIKKERYFDFLEDKFIFTKKVIQQSERSRSINSISMYSAIKEAYNEHKHELIIPA